MFLVTAEGPRIVEASEYPAIAAKGGVQLATQSGPLLLRHGAVHPVSYTHLTLPTICSV